MELSGNMLIGAADRPGGGTAFRAINPATGQALQPAFANALAADIDDACQLAEQAFQPYSELPPARRADFLTAIGEGLMALGDTLVDRAVLETGLPRARIEGERLRTVGQLNLFADVLRQGDFIGAIIEPALPDRRPLPRPDLRQRRVALGPVAVFGASNFPLAFSVAGGDSASALAAGCPVIVKAHPAHPGTSELTGRVIQRAAADAGLPEGVFSLVTGAENSVGEALVTHPLICAVAFTGSRAGGLALLELARRRPVPVPVYAEMSSINPVFLFPAALKARAEAIARGFADSLALGAGQFCTNPGIVLALDSPDLQAFCRHVSEALQQKTAATMLTPALWRAWQNGDRQMADTEGVEKLAEGPAAGGLHQARPAFYATDAWHFLEDPALRQEIFGPTSLLVRCRDLDEMHSVLNTLEGQLTLTLQIDEADYEQARGLIPSLERRAGRILVNGFPTGVDVGYAMVHGGPFPATSDVRTTSVGACAIERFLRPVCYQDFPDALLPQAVRDQTSNPVKRYS